MKSFGQNLCLSTFAFVLIFLIDGNLIAEGTPQVAPNGSITINGTQTNDVAALHINNNQFNNFASYNNTDVNSRLHIHIVDPSQECIYLGFNFAHLNNTSQNPTRQNFEYRILDPGGNIVYGPRLVNFGSPQINSWQEAMNGPSALNGSGGYEADFISSADLSSQSWTGKGDYYIEFNNLSSNDPFLIDYWDITVVDCSSSTAVEKPGRVWSYNWAIFAINDFGFPNRPFNGSFYVCAPDPVNTDAAYITRIDFNGSGFRPAAFNVAFNSFGTTNTGNISEDRRSFENRNVTIPEYAIFLNDPVDICQTALGGGIDVLGVSGCDPSNYCISYISTQTGQIDLLLDFDGQDNVFTPSSADVMITGNVIASEVGSELCLEWDGLNGLGESVMEMDITQIPVSLSFAQGIYHFPIYDAELMTEGFRISAVRPSGPDPLLYYDDRNISVLSGTGEPPIQLMGCNLPCHGWTNYTDPAAVGFGNLNTINSWWFSQQILSQDVFLLPANISCNITGENEVCEGDNVILSASEAMEVGDSMGVNIITRNWNLNGSLIGQNTMTISASEAGEYEYYLEWVTSIGDTCSTSCFFDVAQLPSSSSTIDTTLSFGDTLFVNSIGYSQEGEYEQIVTASNGCDSTIIIIIGLIDPVYTCEIIGDSPICFGDTATLEVITMLIPSDGVPLPIQSIEWSGPGLSGNVMGSTLDVTRQGTYIAVVNWLSSSGENRFTDCSFDLQLNPRFATNIDTLITEGQVLDINGLLIDEPGQYDQFFVSQNGCDSIVIINVISQNAVVFYDFDDCRSTDYEKFQAEYPNPVLCGTLNASNVYRINPLINAHSCTPGVNGNTAVCVSSLESCIYEPGNEKSIIFELEVIPHADSVVNITSLDFFERAPEEFQWIVGTRGVNNYPLFYGLRVLKNNVEIFRQEDNPTTTNWSREIFNFVGMSAFRISEPSLLRFELLPYCLVGADSNVTAWDIDELSIQANCGLEDSNKAIIEGQVITSSGIPFKGALVQIRENGSSVSYSSTNTDLEGKYTFEVNNEKSYIIDAEYDFDYLNGVSTMDLLAIQRHILGIAAFDSPYQYISADADHSNSISAIDILELRKLILGVYEELPQNDSWSFVDARQELDVYNVWQYNNYLELDRPVGNSQKQNFRAIKIGDVDHDHVLINNKSNNVSKLTDETVDLVVTDQSLIIGQQYKARITVESVEEFQGMQLSFRIHDGIIHNVSAYSNGLAVDVMYHEDNDILKVNMISGESLESLELVIEMSSLAEQNLSDVMSIYNDGNENAIYNIESHSVYPLGIRFDKSELNIQEVIKYQPNPFTDETTMTCFLSEEASLDINIFSLNGQRVGKLAVQGKKGENRIIINDSVIGNVKGLLIVQMRSNETIVNSKMIRY